jgi:hypothetical protein
MGRDCHDPLIPGERQGQDPGRPKGRETAWWAVTLGALPASPGAGVSPSTREGHERPRRAPRSLWPTCCDLPKVTRAGGLQHPAREGTGRMGAAPRGGFWGGGRRGAVPGRGALTPGPRDAAGTGRGGRRVASVLLLCERRRLGFSKVNSASSSSSLRLFLL